MLTFTAFGAAQQVTGSCHLLHTPRARVLVDCGMFQGGRDLLAANAADFGFDPQTIDALLLTHAHLDHCGRIPLLVRRGFRGRIFCTAPTRELARLVLADAAGLQEEEARRAARHARRRGDEAAPPPLYTLADALRVSDFFAPPVRYGQRVPVADGVWATFVNAGHMLGSASLLVEVAGDAGDAAPNTRVFFSGDLGGSGRPLLADPVGPPLAPDVVVMETTYGDRDHRSWAESVDELIDVVRATHARGGNVVIPTFALERAQEVLYALSLGVARGALPRHMAIFLDSPMAISATEVFARYPDALRPTFAEGLRRGEHPFDLPGLRLTRETAESMATNTIRGGAVIMAGSGMATGGRVLHHLRHNIGQADNAIVFVGYAAPGTLARSIIDGAKTIRLFGEELPVRASRHTINGFSAHAGRSELLQWLQHCGRPRQVLLVHGDAERGLPAFAQTLQAQRQRCHMPAQGEVVRLD